MINRRIVQRCAALVPLLVLCACASTSNDELQRLRSENEQLRQQLQASGAQPPAPATATVAVVTPAPVTPPAAVVATPALPAAAPAPAAAAAPAAAPLPTPPPGYALVKIDPAQQRHAFDSTGCSDGWFGGPAGGDAPWTDQRQWDDLRRGMSMPQVEKILGEQHYNVANGDRVSWQYGKCGHMIMSSVVFIDGRLAYWERPDR